MLAFGELRLGRRVPTREGCLAVAAKPRRRTSLLLSNHPRASAGQASHRTRRRPTFGLILARPAYAFRDGMHGLPKRIVYVLRSDVDPSRHYVGITSNVHDRLEWHNHGPSGHTVANRPWSLVVPPSDPNRVCFGVSSLRTRQSTRSASMRSRSGKARNCRPSAQPRSNPRQTSAPPQDILSPAK